MTKRAMTILSACLALSAWGCGVGVETGGSITKSAAQPAAAWAEFAPPDGGFSVVLPGKPQEGTTKEPAGEGKEIEHHSFSLITKPNAYIVDYVDMDFDMPESGKATLYDALRDGNIEARKAKIVEEKDITVDGVVGRNRVDEQETKMGPFVMKTRSFLAGRRFYTVMASAPKATLKVEEADRFLDSFHITKPAKPAEEPTKPAEEPTKPAEDPAKDPK